MRTLFFTACVVFSTVFVYSTSAVADPDDYYTQLRKTKDLNTEKAATIRKKTTDQRRIHEVNSLSAKIAEENKNHEKDLKGDARDDDSTDSKPVLGKKNLPNRLVPTAGIPNVPLPDTPPLKVNKEDFPDDIDFSSETPATKPTPAKK